jgi:hypothetical protein
MLMCAARPTFKLGTECLRSYIRALEDISKRDQGLTVATPPLALPSASATAEGGTLQDALEGSKNTARDRSALWTSLAQRADVP